MEIRVTDWRSSRTLLRRIRDEVFIREQGVPASMEWDEQDLNAIHFLALDSRNPVGCARLLPDGKLGRMAVLKQWRHEHWGSRILNAVEEYARHELGLREIKASAQAQALGFYLRNGFSVRPGFYEDAGIPHLDIYKAPGGSRNNGMLVAGEDTKTHELDSLLAMRGWTEMALAAGPRQVCLSVANLRLPYWSQPDVVEALRRYVCASPRRRVKMLFREETKDISGHPLVKLQQRLSSRISLGIHSGVEEDCLLTGPWGYLLLTEPGNALACLNDPARVRRRLSDLTMLMDFAQRPREARRLSI